MVKAKGAEQPSEPKESDGSQLRMFARAVQARSFSGAAKAMGVDVSTVTRAVARLEADLGAKLFFRSTTGLALTEAGHLYHAHAERTLAEESRVRASIADRNAHAGTLRVSMPVFVAEHVLPTMMPALLARHPEARLDVHASDDRVDLLASAFDLAVRLGPLPSSALHATKIAEFRRITCASPAWVVKNGPISRPEDLSRVSVIAYGNGPAPVRWTFCNAAAEEVTVQLAPSLRSNNLDLLVAIAAQGLGVVRMPSWAAAPSVARGELVTLLDDWEANRPGESLVLYGLYPDDPGKARLRKAFLQALVEAARSGPTPARQRGRTRQ
ncbi:MAG: LysR family transcriptional regulator [Polyangiaceae bacterium]|nr:LysR family transcriptional regulator [Polyangiaceae bacterium]